MRANYQLGNAAVLATILAAPAIVHQAAYANSLTRLIPDLYAGLDVVSRELVGIIPAAFRNANAERAAVGQSVVYHVTPSVGLVNIAPSMTTPEPADKTIGNGTIAITNAKAAEFGWVGEEQRGLNTGAGYLSVQADLFAQGLRALVNQIELDLWNEAAVNASRAYGTPGTTPFATNHGETAQVRKILDDNGAPTTGRSLIIDTGAGANLRTLSNLTRVSESGSAMTLKDGELINLNGFSIKESAAVGSKAKGTGAGSTTNTAGYAVGAQTITLAAAGTGTILAGDIVTFAGDTNKYVVESGDADVSNGGTITLSAPGLRVAIPAAATAITVQNAAVRSLAFSQNALHLVARVPALPQEGDAAIESMMITDPRSGMTFEIRIYPGYRKIRAEVGAAWGVKAVKKEHLALLLG